MLCVPDRSHVAVKPALLTGPTVSSEINPPLFNGSTMKIGTLLKPPMFLTLPPANRAWAWPMVALWKSASAVRKHLVSELLHSAGRSMIHSADARWHEAQGLMMVKCLPLVTSLMLRLNLPPVYVTFASMVSPGFTLNTFAENAGNISYQASYWGVVWFLPPQKPNVPSCSTVSVVKPSRPTQFDVHWLALPGQVTFG